MVCTLIVLVHSMPQGLEIGDSGDSFESLEIEYETGTEFGTESETEIETSTMAISSSSTTTTTTSTTSTTLPPWMPTRTTTTARPFQPLRPNRPLASMIHSTLQTIESVVVTSGILATSWLESFMPSNARPINPGNSKSHTSNKIITDSQLPEYSTLDFRENELQQNFK